MPKPLKTLKELQKQHYLSDWIVITDILPDNKTCVTQNGTLVQVLKLDGIDYTSMTVSDRESLFNQRKTFFERIDENIDLSVFACRRKVESEKQVQEVGQRYAQEINEKQAERFTTSFETEIYVVLKQKLKGMENLVSLGSKNFSKEQSVLMSRANEFSSKVDVIKSGLQKFGAEVLTHNDEFSDLVAFWNYILNGGVRPKTTTKSGCNSAKASAKTW